ncbi:hypothetical protein K7472_08200 [Streptomyces sp. PTM05]|uniref:Carbonic anhydrase n=1 Tax=Streptantibioticus parmotrematis TaxID=2873249 RepID=A0ABS7QNR8_9ACTN|nr:hypothetical protein [Streptantibioticus parmotrematis]MBY8884827.1 hypothetical protein [Streptantibioticus parmotrematis]
MVSRSANSYLTIGIAQTISGESRRAFRSALRASFVWRCWACARATSRWKLVCRSEGSGEAARSLPGDQVDNTVRAQIRLTVRQLRCDPLLAPLEAQGRMHVVGAYYSLDCGTVDFL